MNIPPGIQTRFGDKTLRFVWTYAAAAQGGAPLGYVARYDAKYGDKAIVPFFKRNGVGWVQGGPPEPRPLFGLDALTTTPDRAVIITEGEKTTQALHSLGLVAVTSQGGSKAADHADWTPLAGRKKVVILPDRDEPGEQYARDVYRALLTLDRPPERIVLVRLPNLPDRGDTVDWLKTRLWADWDGFEPIPNEERDSARGDLEAVLKELEEPPPEDWKPPADEWLPIITLDTTHPLPPWPADALPEPLGGFAKSLAESTETPPEMAALVALSTAAACVAGRYRVRLKADYFEPVNSWTASAMLPGCLKSPVFRAATAPLMDWEDEQSRLIEPEIIKVTSLHATMSARIAKLRQQAAGKRGDDGDVLQREIDDLEARLPVIPRAPQLWTEDVTPEHLGTLMSVNNERMAVLSDEGGLFSIMAGRYSRGDPNLDIYLKGYSCSPCRVNRGNRPPVFLRHPALTLALTIQPDVLASLSNTAAFRGRGLLGRFLYAVPPSNLGYRTLDAPSLSERAEADWRRLIFTLLNREPLREGQDDDDPPVTGAGRKFLLNDQRKRTQPEGRIMPWIIRLDQAAYRLWRDYRKEVEIAMREGGRFSHMTDWAGKAHGQCGRLAGLLHIAHHAGRGEMPELVPISAHTMTGAIRIMKALEDHALVAYGVMGADQDLEGARVVAQWLQREGIREFSFRECHYVHKHRFKRANDLEPCVQVLIERGYTRLKPGQPLGPMTRGGRPSRQYEVNPVLHGEAF